MEKKDARLRIMELRDRYNSNREEYESSEYLEQQLRTDFLDEFFEILGWDIGNKAGLPLRDREVLVEKGKTIGRPDYTFRREGEDVFFIEAKSPRNGTDKPDDIFQTKRYGWSSSRVLLSILTDFKTFKVFDTRIKPINNRPRRGLIFETSLDNYPESDFDSIWRFSKNEVFRGSIEDLLLDNPESKRQRIPVDIELVEQLSKWRESLAKSYYKNEPDLEVSLLNDVVQKLLDRLIFIRILEDRKIIESHRLEDLIKNWRRSQHKNLQIQLNMVFKSLNRDFNGEIFKPHPCEYHDYDSDVVADIIEELYPPKSPFDFSIIDVELLGTIYERYLGKTLRLTPKRVKIEDKPEVRKAGGVYYTPKGIVDKIIDDTIGELIKNKTPEEISQIRILDPACGSGSFLIGTLAELFEYHLSYYLDNLKEANEGTLFPRIRRVNEEPQLSIYTKSEILKNNIFGVDIDPQAVEITMMSLYIKVLEGERALPHNKELLPSLANNIRSGNSLIGPDFYEQTKLDNKKSIEKINAFDWKSEKTGFGEIFNTSKGFDVIIGNPPYVRSILLKKEKRTWEYYRNKFTTAFKEFDLYLCFLEKSYSLLAPDGRLGFIMPNKWLHAQMGESARKFFSEARAIESIINFNSYQIFSGATTYTMLIYLRKNSKEKFKVLNYIGDVEAKKIALQNDIGKNWERGFVEYKGLGHGPWNLITGDAQRIFKKISQFPEFGQLFTLSQGTGTRADKVFFVTKILETQTNYKIYSKETEKEHIIEKKYVKPSAKGKDVGSYKLINESQLLIYPYENRTLIKKEILQKESPKLWKYLEQTKEALEKRENGRFKGPNYYCYGRPQNHDKLADEKIIVPVIVNHAKAAWDSNGIHIIDSVYFVRRKKPSEVALEYILGILNSQLLTYYLIKTSSNLRGGYFTMKPGYVNKFPLKTIFTTKQDKNHYENIIRMVKRINSISTLNSNVVEREIIALKEKIDETIFELYELKDTEKKIIKQLVESR